MTNATLCLPKLKRVPRLSSVFRKPNRNTLITHLSENLPQSGSTSFLFSFSWCFRANGEVPHATKDPGSFWWKDVFKLSDMFRGVVVCTVVDGPTVLFWSDV
jgi:hypothetical protein